MPKESEHKKNKVEKKIKKSDSFRSSKVNETNSQRPEKDNPWPATGCRGPQSVWCQRLPGWEKDRELG